MDFNVDGATVGDEVMAELEARAKEAAGNAYAHYSNFPVGAAILCASGKIYSGCNVENASYGITICAERNAIHHAAACGERVVLAVVVYTPTQMATPPCGACRQVINEFGPCARVRSVCQSAQRCDSTLDQLLPGAFGPQNLG